jgi:hypothetical protein
MKALVAFVLLSIALGAVALLAGCGSSSSAQEVQPSVMAVGQSPIDSYGDEQAGGTATPVGARPATRSDRATSAELARVHLVSVGLGAGDKYIAVQFKAPPKLARRWQAGMVYVVDDRTRRVYNEIPNVPVLGDLFGRPQTAGQIGYVMLINKPPLAAGARVTVVLGSFKKAHVHVH